MLTLRQEPAGMLGRTPLYRFTLTDANITVTATNFGCAVTSILVPDREGLRQNVVAGFGDLRAYARNEHYLGCILGRYANRIGEGRFRLKGRTVQLSRNDGPNHLHGGFEGFHTKVWEVSELTRRSEEVGVTFSYASLDGEEGYPGNLRIWVSMSLNRNGSFRIRYEAVTDRATPISLSNHSYFNLSGFQRPLIHDHLLQVHASRYTEKGMGNLPTGRIVPLPGSPLDFRTPARIGDRIGELGEDGGYDHNYVLDRDLRTGPVTAALLADPLSGRRLRVLTDRPGLQVYTANRWDGGLPGSHEAPYIRHGAVALEAQAFPDSPNHEGFPNTILEPGEQYLANTIFAFDLLE